MKAIYPWAEMQIGDVREVMSLRKLRAVRSAGYEWSKKHISDGVRPAFKVEQAVIHAGIVGEFPASYTYRIERTA